MQNIRMPNFIEGPENEAAIRFLKKFVCDESSNPNPYILSGPSGEGKTHLLRRFERLLKITKRKTLWIDPHLYEAYSYKISNNAECYIIDDFSFFLFATEPRIRGIHAQISSQLTRDKKILLSGVGLSHAPAAEKLKTYWPSATAEEIKPSSENLRMLLLLKKKSKAPANLLLEMAQKSRTMREAEAMLISYEACQELNVPFRFE